MKSVRNAFNSLMWSALFLGIGTALGAGATVQKGVPVVAKTSFEAGVKWNQLTTLRKEVSSALSNGK